MWFYINEAGRTLVQLGPKDFLGPVSTTLLVENISSFMALNTVLQNVEKLRMVLMF